MKFRMFKDFYSGGKIAVSVDRVLWIESDGTPGTLIVMSDGCKLTVVEDFQTVFSRLNTVAE